MRVMKLLLDLGIKGELLTDGRVLLDSGDTIGVSHDDARESRYCRKCVRSLIKATIAQQSLALGEKAPTASVYYNGTDGLMAEMFPQESEQLTLCQPETPVTTSGEATQRDVSLGRTNADNAILAEDSPTTVRLKNTVNRLKEELRLTKEQLREQESSSAVEIDHLRRQTLASRDTIRKISQESFQSTEELRKKYEDYQSTHKDNVQKIMDHSKDLLKSKSDMTQVIPEHLERERAQQSRIDALSQTLEQRDDAKRIEELRKDLAIVKMQKDSLEHRFSCYRKEADLDKHKLHRELKQSERERREAAATLQYELCSLFKYTQKISELLTRCVNGEFPMRFRGTSYRINIPREIVPRDPFAPTKQDQRPFKALKELVRSIERDGIELFNRSKVRVGSRITSSGNSCQPSIGSSEHEISVPQEDCKTTSLNEQSDEITKYRRKLHSASIRENNLRTAMRSQQRLLQKQLTLEQTQSHATSSSRNGSQRQAKTLTSPLRPSLTAADAVRRATEEAGLIYFEDGASYE
eukprot:gb/GECG01011796.1/.p1 GENE.gb/GECG01011796.1/~~gb/GECG01011796.1/.p1  ORF type:complete len:524 (+),score=79.89 gb/GECG01011796.1/:1-1572(+)